MWIRDSDGKDHTSFIFSPETQNIPKEKKVQVNILVAWTEMEDHDDVIDGAATESLTLVVTNIKPNLMIGSMPETSGYQTASWAFKTYFYYIFYHQIIRL